MSSVLRINPAPAPQLVCARFLTEMDLKKVKMTCVVGCALYHSYRKKEESYVRETNLQPPWVVPGSVPQLYLPFLTM